MHRPELTKARMNESAVCERPSTENWDRAKILRADACRIMLQCFQLTLP